DATDRSAAGQYETVLGVTRATLFDAVARVRSGTERAEAYGASGDAAVVVQRQVPATRAGVAFSRDPVGGGDTVLIECALGSRVAVRRGDATVARDRVRVGRLSTR